MKKHDKKIESWHIEEYKILSSHYFHEDNYFLRSMIIYSALNTTFIAIASSSFFKVQSFLIAYGIPILGMISSLIWAVSLIRVRYLRIQIEERIKKLEQDYMERIGVYLSVRNRTNKAKYFVQKIPVSKIMLSLPIMFFIIWVVTFISAIHIKIV